MSWRPNQKLSHQVLCKQQRKILQDRILRNLRIPQMKFRQSELKHVNVNKISLFYLIAYNPSSASSSSIFSNFAFFSSSSFLNSLSSPFFTNLNIYF